MGSVAGEKPHAVCLPFPVQGHVTPMLKLAKLLHSRGFHVTFVNNEFNQRRLLRARGPQALDGLPDFRFATIKDGLPPSDVDADDATQDIPSLCRTMHTACLPHLMGLLTSLNDPASGVPPVTCLVLDGTMSFGYDAAKEIGVPCVATWFSSTCGFIGYRHYRQLMDWDLVPLKEEAQLTNGYLDTPVEGVPGLCAGIQLRDFPSFIRTTDRGEIIFNYMIQEAERLSLPLAVMLNTFDELERPALDAMAPILPPMYTVGPLHLLARQVLTGTLDGMGSNLWKEHEGLLEWLDGHPPRSVVYVNYGSTTVMTNEQLLEFAWGLANSGYAFLWNIRPDLVKGNTAVLPPEFTALVEGRSLMPSWCPQEKVLEHPAVGVFLTHSGWNSTLESICSGVPMLSWPFFAEQQTNCRYKRTEWGNGMEIGGDVRRADVEAMIREAMEGEKGKEMRRRAMAWRELAVTTARPGGRSMANLEKVINEVLLSKINYAKAPRE